MSDHKIAGYCPMGCGQTLFRGSGGYITCSWVSCPCPDAVATLLENPETEHIVVISDETFDVQHPLRERLQSDLFRCDLHDWFRTRSGHWTRPGRYRVLGSGSVEAPYNFVRVSDE